MPAARRAVGQLYQGFAKGYVFAFGRPRGQAVNKVLFHLALRGQGFNNGWLLGPSGEGRFIKRLAGDNPKVCVDVGANKGEYSAELLSTTNAKVIAFEPLPKAYESLAALSATYPGRLTTVNCGVGDQKGDLVLHYGAADSEHASFSTEVNEIDYVGAGNVNTMTVPVVTLDDYFADADPAEVPQIDLIKIDTEGFEHEVLVGAAQTIAKYRPKYIQIEYNLHQLMRGHSLYSLSRLLPDYVPHQILPYGSGLMQVDPKRPEPNTFCFSNVVFIRRDTLPLR